MASTVNEAANDHFDGPEIFINIAEVQCCHTSPSEGSAVRRGSHAGAV
jgi:hypothetical protein